ncbi:MAG: AraC family transcriptional regulator, partial [Flavobacteriaceae bacterium]|nr:AraC family transcriptional regulator [Flavobacteriaceae bacterium]
MKLIKLKNKGCHHIAQTLADGLNGDYNEFEPYSDITFQNEIGAGKISIIKVSPSCTTLIFDLHLNQIVQLNMEGELANLTSLYFCLEGSLMHSLKGDNDYKIINFRQNSIFKGSNKASILHLPKDENLKLTVIFLRPSAAQGGSLPYLQSISDHGNIHIDLDKDNLYLGRHCVRTAKFVEELLALDSNDNVKLVFKHAAILNIIASQIERYYQDCENPLTQTELRGYDLEKIREIEKFIIDNLTERLSIDDLTRVAGISPNKLQNGFRYLYSDTVNSYITDKRLELAIKLFESDKYNI